MTTHSNLVMLTRIPPRPRGKKLYGKLQWALFQRYPTALRASPATVPFTKSIKLLKSIKPMNSIKSPKSIKSMKSVVLFGHVP